MSSVAQCHFRSFFRSNESPIRLACALAFSAIVLSAFLQTPAQAQEPRIITYKGTKFLLKNGAKFSRQRDTFYCAERDDPFMIRNFADYDGRNDPLEYRYVVGCRSEEYREPEDVSDGVSSNAPGTSPEGPEGPPDGPDGPGGEGEPQ